MASQPPRPRARARDAGVDFGSASTGPWNAITDVAGVRVGQVTLWSGDDVRTGVTAVVPAPPAELYERPMAAAPAVLNGAGELTGLTQMREWGLLETPIVLTSTSAVGRAYDAVVDAMMAGVPAVGVDEVVIPTVGECDDSWLDAAWRRSVRVDDVRSAIDAALGPGGEGAVAEGVVGAGTGMVAFGHKAGVGTASRLVDGGTVGVLLLANFGSAADLRVPGVAGPVPLATRPASRAPAGSCIGVVATDLPLDRHQLARVAARVGLGLARVGSVGHHGSGEIFCAFSTTMRLDRGGRTWERAAASDDVLDGVFAAVVSATEEAALDSLYVADTVSGRDGHTAPGLPV